MLCHDLFRLFSLGTCISGLGKPLGRDPAGSGAARGSVAGQLAPASRLQPGQLAAASRRPPHRELPPRWSSRPRKLLWAPVGRLALVQRRVVHMGKRYSTFGKVRIALRKCASRTFKTASHTFKSGESSSCRLGALNRFRPRPRCQALARCRNTIRKAISRDTPSGPRGAAYVP